MPLLLLSILGLQEMVLFGGGSGGIDQNTTWLWDQVGATWIHLSTAQSPPAREGAGMAYDAALQRVILFGGQDNNGYFQRYLGTHFNTYSYTYVQAPQLHLHQHPLHQLLPGPA